MARIPDSAQKYVARQEQAERKERYGNRGMGVGMLVSGIAAMANPMTHLTAAPAIAIGAKLGRKAGEAIADATSRTDHMNDAAAKARR